MKKLSIFFLIISFLSSCINNINITSDDELIKLAEEFNSDKEWKLNYVKLFKTEVDETDAVIKYNYTNNKGASKSTIILLNKNSKKDVYQSIKGSGRTRIIECKVKEGCEKCDFVDANGDGTDDVWICDCTEKKPESIESGNNEDTCEMTGEERDFDDIYVTITNNRNIYNQ